MLEFYNVPVMLKQHMILHHLISLLDISIMLFIDL